MSGASQLMLSFFLMQGVYLRVVFIAFFTGGRRVKMTADMSGAKT